MSTLLVFGDERPGRPELQIATNRGWIDVGAWADGLGNQANELYPELMQLVDHGESHDLKALKTNIDSAMRNDGPSDATVATTLKGLRDVVESNIKEEYALVSDGFFSGYSDIVEDAD